MSRRTRRYWGEAESSCMLAGSQEFHLQVIALMTRAPVASPVYLDLLSLSDATLKARLFQGHDPSAESIGADQRERHVSPKATFERRQSPIVFNWLPTGFFLLFFFKAAEDQMTDILGFFHGDIDTTESLLINGTVEGNVTGRSRANIEINGTVIGNVIIFTGARVTINGTIVGYVENFSGKLDVFGTLDELREHPTSVTNVDSKAVIGKRINAIT